MATIPETSEQNVATTSTDETTQNEATENPVPEPVPPPPTEGAPNSDLIEVKQSTARKFLEYLEEHIQAVMTIVAVIIAFPIGIGMKSYRHWSPREVSYVKYLGELYLSMFQGLVIPLITATMITSVGTMDVLLLKKVGGVGAGIFLVYNLFAGLLGVVIGNVMVPGEDVNVTAFVEDVDQDDAVDQTLLQDKLMDIVRAMFPRNVVLAALQSYSTRIGCPDIGERCMASKNDREAVKKCCVEVVLENFPNNLGLTVFSVTLGVALAKSGIYARPVLAFFQSLAESTVTVTTWVMWVTPFATFSLTLADVLGTSNTNEIDALVKFFGAATVTLGILTLSYPILYVAFMRRSPMPFLEAIGPALLTAVTTSSSLITIPILIKCLDDANVNRRVSRILIPLGIRMNLNGTTAFYALAATFIGQVNNVGRDGFYKTFDSFAFQGIWIGSTALTSSIGGIPGGGQTTLKILLNIIGVNGDHSTFILPTDAILDPVRTTVNVFGCAIIAALVSHWYHDELQRLQSYDLKKEESVLDKLTYMKELTDPLDPEEEVLRDPTEMIGDSGRKKKKLQMTDEHLMEAGMLPSATTPKKPKSKKKRKFKLTKLKRKTSKSSKRSRSSSKKPSGVSKLGNESEKSEAIAATKKVSKSGKKNDEPKGTGETGTELDGTAPKKLSV